MMEKVTLILGGIHSGKSHYGEELALGYERRPVYLVATGRVNDNLQVHLRKHQRRRGDRFDLLQEQQDLRLVLAKCPGRTVLVNSLTRHLAHRLKQNPVGRDSDQHWENDRGYLNEILSIQQEKGINLILLSDEMGYGPLAGDSDERVMQELLGHWNQHLACLANQVIRVTAGIPQLLKRQPAARFRLGAPSNVLPGDLIQNVLYLRRQVSDVQLVFKDYSVISDQNLQQLLQLKGGQDLSCSVHMPLSTPIHASPDLVLERALPLIESLADLNPLTHTFHFDVPKGYIGGQADQGLIETYIQFFARLKTRFPGLSFSLENIDTALAELDPVIDDAAVSYAIDIGHLLRKGHPLGEVRERLGQAAVVHLHHAGPVEASPDAAVDHLPLPAFAPYLSLLSDYSGLVTIENYHPQHLEQSLETVRSYF